MKKKVDYLEDESRLDGKQYFSIQIRVETVYQCV